MISCIALSVLPGVNSGGLIVSRSGSAKSVSSNSEKKGGMKMLSKKETRIWMVAIIGGVLLLMWATGVFGQEAILQELNLVGFGKCVKAESRQVVPCAGFTKEGEERIFYLAIFSEDGSKIMEIIRQDHNTGKEQTLWLRPPQVPEDMLYPQKQK